VAELAELAERRKRSEMSALAERTPSTPGDPELIQAIAARSVGGYVSIADVAVLLGLNRAQLQKAAYLGFLPAKKPLAGRTAPWMVTFPDLGRYLTRGGDRRRRGRPAGSKNGSGTRRPPRVPRVARVEPRPPATD
jgi:hypothetical protein